jgi:transketolase
MSTGSLGQGLSFAVGIALAAQLDSKKYRTYALIGDGECNEGQIWEAAMSGAHFKLDNLVAIIDHNGQQIDGWNSEIMNIEPMGEKWRSFGWNVIEIDGHNLEQVIGAFGQAKMAKGKPTVIIARTTKGKGVSFMENNLEFHGRAPKPDEAKKALEELE